MTIGSINRQNFVLSFVIFGGVKKTKSAVNLILCGLSYMPGGLIGARQEASVVTLLGETTAVRL